MADAWHHRSDAFSSVGSLIGIGGAMLGFPVLDPLASVVICIFILKVAFDIFKDALDKMLDTSCSEEYEEKLADYIRKSRGVERLDLLRTRMFGNKVYIDAEIAVDGTLSLKDAHAIAEDVHDNVEKKFPNTKHQKSERKRYSENFRVVDPRYYYDDIREVMKKNKITSVLFLYNGNTFVQDNSISGVLQND